MKRNWRFLAGLGVAAALIAVCGMVPTPRADQSWGSLPPSTTHLLGTTPDGRDLLALCANGFAHAAREAMTATILTMMLGLIIGLLAARHQGGSYDRVQSVVAKLLDSIGPFLLAACLATVVPRVNWFAMAVFLAFIAWPNVGAVVRSEAIAIGSRPYVEAARALGVRPFEITVRHYMPAMADRLAPLGFALFASFVALFGALGFIGVGVASEQGLGFLLFDAQSFIRSSPWYWMSCTLAFAILLLAAVGAMKALPATGGAQSANTPEEKALLS